MTVTSHVLSSFLNLQTEIYLTSNYNLKADTYSWAMTFYELLTLEKPYLGISDIDFQNYVLGQGMRPTLTPYALPDEIKRLLQSSWAQFFTERYTMKKVFHTLQSILHKWEAAKQHQQEQLQRYSAMNYAAAAAASTTGGRHHHQQSQAQHPQSQPVFTFETSDLVTFEKQLHRKSNTIISNTENLTLPTEASTQSMGDNTEIDDFDDQESVSTFDCSLSSLMDVMDMGENEEGGNNNNGGGGGRHHHQHNHRGKQIRGKQIRGKQIRGKQIYGHSRGKLLPPAQNLTLLDDFI